MAINLYTIPYSWMAGYSAIPLRADSSLYPISNKFNYLVNIVYDLAIVISTEVRAFNGNTFLNIKSNNHPYKIGDTILLVDDLNTGYYTDYYTVYDVVDSNNFIIDLTLSIPFGVNTVSCYKVIKYKIPANESGEVEINMQNTLKDFVSQNLEDVDEVISAEDTVFDYEIYIGEELDYVYDFDDNYFVTGNVGFIQNGLSASNILFEVGDTIKVEQDLFEWVYDDNFFDLGNVGFTSSNGHNFLEGQEITITGQLTNPNYNGNTTIREVQSSNSLVTYKGFNNSSPTEGGIITGVPKPEYNRVATIIDIIDTIGGAVVVTDMGYTGGTLPISGKITYINKLVKNITSSNISKLSVYNARIPNENWDIDVFDDYVIRSGSPINKASTILSNITDFNRIERYAKSFILIHSNTDTYAPTPHYKFYDLGGNLISYITMSNVSGNTKDYYTPSGLEQINNSTNQSLVSGSPLASIIDSVVYYTIEAGTNLLVNTTSPVKFKLNDDCSRYDTYNIMWKDSLGSFISYPFKYVSIDSTEVEKKSYYKKEGRFDKNTNTFNYETYDRGEDVYYSRSRDTILLNSGWVNDSENIIIKDLLQSASLYVQKPNGNLYSASLEDKKLSFGEEVNDSIYNYKLTVRLSSNEYRF